MYTDRDTDRGILAHSEHPGARRESLRPAPESPALRVSGIPEVSQTAEAVALPPPLPISLGGGPARNMWRGLLSTANKTLFSKKQI